MRRSLTLLLERMKQTIARYEMLKKGDRVIVAVSGGPDSTALLYGLNAVKKEFDISLIVVHLNHMLRKDAAQDAMFVKRAAKKLNLPVVIDSINIPRLASASKSGIEETARNSRYDFYLRTARGLNANKIALGHTRDDQAETVLMRLIRGSGLLGLCAIPPIRRIEEKLIIRPFIEVSRDEIMRFLSKKGISFRRDPTNTEPVYLRNRVRLRLMPFLKKGFNPAIKETLAQLARNIRVDYDYLLHISERRFRRYIRFSKGSVKVSLKFLNENPAIQRMIVREAVRRLKGDLNSITYSHWEELNSLLEKRTKWSLSLPGQITVRRIKNNLIFNKGIVREKQVLGDVVSELKIPGETRLWEIGRILKTDFIKGPINFQMKKSKKEEYFDFEKLRVPLLVRFKRPGDKIRPLGMERHKRLKQLFIDEKAPIEKRGGIPLLVSGNKIIWVCGVKRSEEAKIKSDTKRVLRVRIE